MKNYYVVLFFTFLFGASFTQAQVISKDEKRNVKQPPKLIILEDAQKNSAGTAQQLLTEVYQLDQANQFSSLKQSSDKLGFTHQEFQQLHQGVKVEFARTTVHAKNGEFQTVSGEFYDIKDLEVQPSLSNDQAFQRAIAHIGAQQYLWEFPDAAAEMDNYQRPTGELVILPMFGASDLASDYRLAYKFDIYATYPISRGDLYVDAQTGQALFYNATIKHVETFGHIGSPEVTVANEHEIAETSFDNYTSIEMMATGTAATRYSGSQTIETQLTGGNYILADTGRKVYTRDALNQAPSGGSYPYVNNYGEFTDNDNNWTSAEHSANKDNAALDAHWGAMETYDYFLTEHNRNSYDNNGAQIRSYVHVDNNYDNAFWNGSVMSYGDGSSNGNEGNGFFDALTSIDVAAHEIGHAVTTFTADLAYQRESGGLNEGFSDIWGAAVEHYAKGNGSDSNPTDAIWLIGDEIDRRSGSAALRSMNNPTSLGQPDTYGGQFWQNPNCGIPTQSNDYCGVHTNSGVLNYWFYLLVEGGSGTNDVGDNFNVSGIGMNKSAQISYRTLNNYLSANSTFADARAGAIQAARDLYGAGGQEEISVTNAWYAVNVGAAFGQIDYCSSNGNSVADEYISRVQVGDINNASGAGSGGYQNHTAVETDLAKNTQYTITVTPTWTGTVYSEGYAVWIDYNKDGDFADSGEQVASIAATQNTPVSASFTVPTSAADGATRMRVSMKYNGTPTSCESFSYGEVEDYTVNIGGSAPDTQAPSNPANLSASNVTTTTVDLSWNASSDNVGVTAYDVYQGNTVIATVSGTSRQVTGLSSSTAYSFRVRAKDAAGNVSGFSNTVNVTTATPPDTQAPSNPTNLSASNVAETTLTLNWTASSDNVGVTAYDVFQGSTNLGEATGTSANITGLTANTAYSFRVRAKDAAGNVSGFSNTVNVTTAGGGGGNGCANGVSSFPYAESFESSFGAWTNNTNDDIQWTRDSAGTPSSNTGPSTGSAGSFYVFVEASGNGTGYPDKQAILTSPCFDLSGETAATFNFDYHMYGAADMGNLIVEASDDNGASWTSLFAETGNKGNVWNSASLDLTAYAGGSVQVRFNRTTGSTWQADIALDNISLTAGAGNQGPPTGYCASSSNNTNDEFISRVQIGSINNASGASAGGYGDFTSQSTTLGANNTITITPTWTGTVYSEGYAVWVDFNRDGDFGDAGELVFSRAATTATSVSGSFGVPAGASTGATRMRVSMMYNGIPTACQNFTYGEVEDYVVVIANGSFNQGVAGPQQTGLTDLEDDVATTFGIYPNPVKGSTLNVEFVSRDSATFSIHNLLGQQIAKGKLNNTINVSQLQSGVYLLSTTIDGRETTQRFVKE